ncbi:copper oxidase [Chitiniphilus shinanonensis]|uniref:Copper oxidase n=1 Tax=Chitiniphilus shinanonensis TaxID=553088 RepID=A0ABQ6BPF5_9NEIS|nr:cupredoxin family protein [Chitiniphilus shinanonensis]GLS03711.1 copper oxidase [Chitiniphilus shinanonensis]
MKQLTIAALCALSLNFAFAAGEHDHGDHGAAKQYAFGSPGQDSAVSRTVKVSAGDDMKFSYTPPLKTIKQGETIRFVITNTGKLAHEFSVGDAASQRAHALMMKKMPDMKHADDPSAVSLAPGETRQLVWRFDKAMSGDVIFACQVPGHYDAGMKTNVPLATK